MTETGPDATALPERDRRGRLREAARTRAREGWGWLLRSVKHLRGIGVLVWAVLLVGTGALFLTRERTDLVNLGRELRSAQLGWLLLALGAQLTLVGLMGFQQKLVYRLLGQRLPYWLLLPLFLRRTLIATIVPGGAPLSLAMQVRRLADHGVPTSIGLFGEILSASIGTVSFVSLLVPVALALLISGGANTATIVATAILMVLCTSIVVAFRFALRPDGPPTWLNRRLPARFRDGLSEARAQRVTLLRVLPIYANALVIDLLGVLVLFLSIRSIHFDLSALDVLVGYTVGSAFLFITPIFGGLGIVELSMATALMARGLPASAALGGVLVYRAFELWLPLALGVASEPLVRRGSVGLARGGLNNVLPRLPAIAVALTGLLTVLSVLSPHIGGHRFQEASSDWILSVPSLARSFALVSGLMLIGLAWGLWRRKRLAWLVAVGILALVTVAHLSKGHDTGLAIGTAVTLLLLVLRRSEFRVRTDIPTAGGVVAGMVGSLIVALGYGTLGFYLLDRRDFGDEFGFIDALRETVRLYLGMGRGDLTPRTHYAAWFLDSIGLAGIFSIGLAGFSLWRPLIWRKHIHPQERQRARAFIARYGDSSLDTFKGWDDKLFFFTSDGRGLVAFQLSNGCALALGDPVVVDDTAFDRTLAEFVEWCDGNGWRYAFHQTSSSRVAAYRRAGLHLLKIGEDAIVDLREFSLEGHAMKGLRSAVRRMERDGYRTVTHRPPHAADVMTRFQSVSDEWLTIEGRRERGFTLGQWSVPYLARCVVITMETADGDVVAFTNLIRDGVPGEATIDLMRRRRDSPNAAMDALFVGTFLTAREAGFETFSLGMVPWVAIGDEPTAPPVERGLRHLNTHMERFFSVRGLYAYKDKFGPRWEPRYLAYASDLDLPRITVAIVRLTERTPTGPIGWNGWDGGGTTDAAPTSIVRTFDVPAAPDDQASSAPA